MLGINIPQHSRGLMIAGSASGFALKTNRFQSVVVEACIVPACSARLASD
jgi:hypothetical protein